MKKPLTLQQHLDNVNKRKELLPLHKMDDLSRRKFLQNVGYFLTAMSVPTMVRLDTLSSLSKKIFGNSLAFAQSGSFATNPIACMLKTRSGYAFNQWVLGAYVPNPNVTYFRQNTPWLNTYFNANPAIATTVGNGLPVFLPPPTRALLSPYVNGIQNLSSISGPGAHESPFYKTFSAGKGEMTTWRAKTEFDSGSETVIKSPFAFGNSNIILGFNDIPSDLQAYAPTAYTNIANIYNQFSAPQFLTNEGTNISAGLRNQILSVAGNKFATDIGKSLYKKDSEQLLAANAQSLQVLATNYRDALNPGFAGNSATMAMLNASLPAQIRMDCAVSITQAIFVGMQAANLGVAPRIFDIIIDCQDWHDDATLPSGSYTTDTRYQSAQYIAAVIANTFSAINNNTWMNSVSGEKEILDFHHVSEFTRGFHLGEDDEGGLDDPDGYTDGGCLISSDNVSTVRFKPGSMGGPDNAYYPYINYNASTNVHAQGYSGLAPMYSVEQGMWLLAKHLNVTLADFGVTGTGTIPNLVF